MSAREAKGFEEEELGGGQETEEAQASRQRGQAPHVQLLQERGAFLSGLPRIG